MKNNLNLINMRDVPIEPVQWLWYLYIPLGKLTMVQGDPGDGKTTFVLAVIAALTKGEPLPECSNITEPMNVIYQTAEDGLSDTIKPRLVNTGADCSRVLVIDESHHELSLCDERLEHAIRETGAKLIVLDPMQAYLGSDVDNPQPRKNLTLSQYTELWLWDIAPGKLAKSTLHRDRQDLERFLPVLGHYKLTDLRPEHFRKLYADLRQTKSDATGKPLSESTVEGVHATLCSILSDAVEGGFLTHNPAWRTYRYASKKAEKKIADEETAQKIIAALENESIKYETYFKLIIATGMRRGECCALQWRDIDWEQRSIHICRNAVKITGDEIFVKEPKTRSGDRYVYFSAEMESLLREYQQECQYITQTYDERELSTDDFLFRRQGTRLPMTPTTFTWRFKCILKKNGLPE